MSSTTSMKMQKQRENELRRLTKAIPDAIRAEWGPHDYTEELRARQPRLFSNMMGANAERFFRLQKIVHINPHPPAPSEETKVEHAAYHESAPAITKVEDPLEVALREMDERISKECREIVGTPRQLSLHKGQLNICNSYQRDKIHLGKVEKIAMAPNMNAFGLLTVAHRASKHWIVDGQHRWLAMCRRSEVDMLPCLVYDSKSEVEEARLYCLINLDRTAVSPLDRYRALWKGGDPVAEELQQCFEALGIKAVTHAGGARQMSCISKVYSIARRDMRQCELVLSVVTELSRDVPISRDLINVMQWLDNHAVEGLLNGQLLVRLKKLGIHKVIDCINRSKTMRTGQAAGELLIGELNAGQPKSRLIKVNIPSEIYDDN